MSARLQSLLADAAVSEEVQDKLATAGLTNLGLFASIGEDGKAVRDFLADVIELDPSTIDDRAERGRVRMEITRVCSAHTVSKTANEIETRLNSERASAQLPILIAASEWTAVRQAFERAEYKLNDEIAPSKPYYERKVTELDNELTAESLTAVTTTKQEEDSQQKIPQIDPITGFFKVTTKTLGIAMPLDAEEYRMRWETMGVCMWYLKARATTKRVLQSFTMQRHESVLKWLFGPEVWGLATRSSEGVPLSTPDIQHVFTYEIALRKEVVKRMNMGVTWWEAWTEAMENPKLQQVHFLSHVAIRPGHSVSAPGMRAATGLKKLTSPPVPTSDVQQATKSRSDKKKEQKKRKADQARSDRAVVQRLGLADAPRQLAILDQSAGSQGAGGAAGGHDVQGRAKGKGKGKGKKGFPDSALHNTGAGDPICIGWNKGNCQRTNCTFKHCCWFCESADHTGANHPR